MIILIFFLLHWYLSLFFQTFFHHRYAAHAMFTMSPATEKVFFVLSWLAQGSSYLSPQAYGIMHRKHHAYADTERDPHSPKYDGNLFRMMWNTKNRFLEDLHEPEDNDERFTQGVPVWRSFDRFTNSRWVRLGWMMAYTAFYVAFATHWWMFLLLPVHFLMGPLHGAIINWFAHRYGYTNFEVSDTSKNLFPLDVLMLGEAYHNNHHKKAHDPNFGHRWHEIDPVWPVIRVLDAVGVIRLKPAVSR